MQETGTPPKELYDFMQRKGLRMNGARFVTEGDTTIVSTLDFNEFTRWGGLTGARNARNADGVWMADAEADGQKITIAFAVRIREHDGETAESFMALIMRMV